MKRAFFLVFGVLSLALLPSCLYVNVRVPLDTDMNATTMGSNSRPKTFSIEALPKGIETFHFSSLGIAFLKTAFTFSFFIT